MRVVGLTSIVLERL